MIRCGSCGQRIQWLERKAPARRKPQLKWWQRAAGSGLLLGASLVAALILITGGGRGI